MGKNESFVNEVKMGRFLIFSFDRNAYMTKIADILKEITHSSAKVCYVCLGKSYKNVAVSIKKEDIDMKNLHFVDTISSYYQGSHPTKNCTFLNSPTNLSEISTAILDILKNEKYNFVVFDSISNLLSYKNVAEIVRFTSDFLSKEQIGKVIYITLNNEVLLPDDGSRLVKDLGMLADKTINL